MWTSDMTSVNYRADLVLERTQRRRSTAREPRRRFERGAERLVVAQRFEIGIAPGERAVLGVQRDGALEVRDRLGMLAALGVGDGQHVEGVVVVRILVADQPQVRDRLVVAARR